VTAALPCSSKLASLLGDVRPPIQRHIDQAEEAHTVPAQVLPALPRRVPPPRLAPVQADREQPRPGNRDLGVRTVAPSHQKHSAK
jgi:hypothetical protein